MALTQIFDKWSNTTTKRERKERRLADTQVAVAKARARKNQEQFLEENQQRRLGLNESLAARGMSSSTHAADQRNLFEHASERALDTLGEDVILAEQGGDIAAYKKKTRNRMQPLNILDDILGLGGGILGAATGMGAIGGAAKGGTSGLDEAFLDYG